ncbi:MAG: transcriptional repressor LexA [candidate division WOR-3 bacterium]|nr:transcriptional repressor LexA [candidate division WOR-3 bacterium]
MLTKRQKEILDFLKKYIAKSGYSPSLEEIAVHFNLSSLSTVHYHLSRLEQAGLISRYDFLPRSIQIEKRVDTPLVQIPLLGLIAAGEPIEVIEEPETISVPKSLLSASGNHYALRVRGDSMIDEGIFDGDAVVIKKQDTAENGEVAVALINGNEATLKKIYRERGRFRLQPANPRLKPIFVRELIIQGKVTGVLRSLENEQKEAETADLFSDKIEIQYAEKTPYPYRKQLGQFFTPFTVADLMTTWVLKNKPASLLDPACGTGVFERSVFKHTSEPIKVTAYDIDKKMIDICERISPAMGTLKMELLQQDYLSTEWQSKYDAIICNPPYLKHHHIKDKYKYISIFREKLNRALGLNTNIYSLFLIKSLSQLAKGGRMAFITPSEFLNSNYGVEVKRHLIESRKWRYLIVFDFKMSVFNGATTTACITLFENTPSDQLTFVKIKNEKGIEKAKNLIDKGSADNSTSSLVEVFSKPLKELEPEIKWKQYFEKQHQSSLLVPFTKYARVMRGIATGANDYFTFSEKDLEKFKIDRKYVVPCLTKANHVPKNIFTKDGFKKLATQNKKTYLLYVNGKVIDENLKKYLDAGESKGIHNKYLTSHRTPWWLTEERMPAPILVIVFGRKGLRFVRNETEVRNLTCFHSIYPTADGQKFINVLMAFLITEIAQKILGAEKREYGNGLEKFEPNDINKGLIIDFERLSLESISKIENVYKEWRKSAIEKQDDTKYRAKLDDIFRDLLKQFKGEPRRNVSNQLAFQLG